MLRHVNDCAVRGHRCVIFRDLSIPGRGKRSCIIPYFFNEPDHGYNAKDAAMNEKVRQIVSTFTDAVVSVLETMAMVKVTPGTPFMKKDGQAKGDVSGIIGMSNTNGPGSGTMSLSFTDDAARGVMGKMLGEEIPEVNNDVIDAVGEVTNMVCGQGRKGMAEFGVVYAGAIPTVITGKGHTIKHVSNSSVLAIPFSTEFGPVTVEICFG